MYAIFYQGNSNGIVMVKLKRKLMYRGHVYFESVRPDLVKQVLYYLKRNNHLYQDIIIDKAHISGELLSLEDGQNDTQSTGILMTDSNCEELAHPYLFPTGKFGYKVQRSINLTPNKYFNQRLLNYKQRFASEADYIFCAHSVYQQMNMTSRINIAMQKVKTNKLTAGMLSQNFNDTLKSFVANDEAYSFMSTIKGKSSYLRC